MTPGVTCGQCNAQLTPDDPKDSGRCYDCYWFSDDCYDGCTECGDEIDSFQSACIDDLCHGGEVPCMHGDWARIPCGLCGK